MCSELAVDLVRNGEGTTHVIRVEVSGAPSAELARDVGKAIVNGNLFCSAVAGNDPNVGRLVGAVGSFLGRVAPDLDLSGCTMRLGGRTIFAGGAFELDAEAEDELYSHSAPVARRIAHRASRVARRAVALRVSLALACHRLDCSPVAVVDALLNVGPSRTSVEYPPHERCVQIEVDLGVGEASATVHGSDLTKEYVEINADYRS